MFEGISWLFGNDNDSDHGSGSLFSTDSGKEYMSFNDILTDARDKHWHDGGGLNLSCSKDGIKPHMDPW